MSGHTIKTHVLIHLRMLLLSAALNPNHAVVVRLLLLWCVLRGSHDHDQQGDACIRMCYTTGCHKLRMGLWVSGWLALINGQICMRWSIYVHQSTPDNKIVHGKHKIMPVTLALPAIPPVAFCWVAPRLNMSD